MFKYFGTAPVRIGTAKTANMALWGELGVNTLELIFVAESAHGRIGKILDDHSLTPRDQLDNGSTVPACRSCQHVFQRFGVVDVNSLRRGSRSKVSSSDLRAYLRSCGFPRTWVRTNETLALLREHGIPVSPAAQEIIRLYGGLSTYHNGGPEGCVLFTIDPARAVSKGVAAVEEVHGVTGLCPIGIDYEGLGLMCIGPDNTIYFQGGPYFKGATVDAVVERLLVGEPDGSNIAPGDIPLQDM